MAEALFLYYNMQEEEQNFSRESSSLVVDIAVVGAGAAGFFAVITAKQMQPQARVSGIVLKSV